MISKSGSVKFFQFNIKPTLALCFILTLSLAHAFGMGTRAGKSSLPSAPRLDRGNSHWHTHYDVQHERSRKHHARYGHHGIRRITHNSSTFGFHTNLHALNSAIEVIPRGGAAASASVTATGALQKLRNVINLETPNGAFNLALIALAASTASLKLYNSRNNGEIAGSSSSSKDSEKDPKVKSLQLRFLTVFWLLRMADWLQGPYFYQVYASKKFNGSGIASGASGMTWVSRLFLTGFASTALFGPIIGRICDVRGRKFGTLMFSLLYSLGAYSTKSNLLGVLLLGRVLGGIGTSLLFSAPEAWLVGEAGRDGVENSLGETFGLAYAGDSIVAILAGQMAGFAATQRGPTGPFELSVGFLILGGLLTSVLWKENVARSGSVRDGNSGEKDSETSKPTIRDAVKVVRSDPNIMLVGAMQSLFEAAMYIFVLNWPPAVSKAVSSHFSNAGSAVTNTPYGTVFSCFMACCLFGSTLFGHLTSPTKTKVNKAAGKKMIPVSTENFAVGMLGLATLAMGSATLSIPSVTTAHTFSFLSSFPLVSNLLSSFSSLSSSPGSLLLILISSFFLFESCVGMYFPTIGTLRSKYFPDSHRSVVMNLFGIPLNAMVVTVFLSIDKLGVKGALGVSTTALGLAFLCGLRLKNLVNGDKNEASSSG